jgi:hypothetical protein
MDTLYSLLINAGHGERISDGVDRATAPAGRVFPYLARPHPSPAAAREPVRLVNLAVVTLPAHTH